MNSHFNRPQISALAFVVVLSGCSATKPECESNETRLAVIEAISGNSQNPLARFAETNARPAAASRNEKPVYQLTQRLVTVSVSEDKRTLTCSGGISVLYGDLKATKEIEFTVQRAPDDKLSISVAPFQF
jgi:hypothetical protein